MGTHYDTQDLLLAQHSRITPGRCRGPYRVWGITPGPFMCKAIDLCFATALALAIYVFQCYSYFVNEEINVLQSPGSLLIFFLLFFRLFFGLQFY